MNEQPAPTTIASLITDQERLTLLELGERISNAQFEIGDLVNAINARAGEGNKMQVYGYVAGLVGKSIRSVMYYAETAGFFPPALRTAYRPLKFEHFKVACAYPELATRMLDEAMNYMDAHNMHLPPVQWMVDYFQGSIFDVQAELNAQTPPTESPADLVESAFDLVPPEIEERETRGQITPGASRIVAERFSDLFNVISRGIAALALPNDRKERIRELLRQLAEEVELAKHEIGR